MWNSVNNKQDRIGKTTMNESTAMTIEFLRARLSAERSISRTARQRAEELAKRVVELEEQLKVVTLERKKAEKATTEILAILENSGIGDFPDAYLSNSDQEEVLNDSKEGDHCTKDEETLTISRQMANKFEGLPDLERQASSINGGDLSLKRPIDSPLPLGRKTRFDQARRANSFVSSGGSPTKWRLGKSRRQTKQAETRSEAVEIRGGAPMLDIRENGAASGSGNISNCFGEIPEIFKEDHEHEDQKLSNGGVVKDSPKTPVKETDDGFLFNESDGDAEMEQALEHKAQLIDRYEEEENAQREWEEKFKDNQSCTPDSCEPGNRSDVTEERNETKVESAKIVHTSPHGQGGTSGVEEVSHGGEANFNSVPNRFVHPHLHNGEQRPNSSMVNESEAGFPEFSFPGQENVEAKSNTQRQGSSKDNSSYSHSRESSEHQAGQNFPSSQVCRNSYKGESSGDEVQLEGHHETPNGLGVVLEALQRAKLSLKHELNRLPQSTPGMPQFRAIEAPVPATTTGDSMELPIGSAGLFRVPTSLQLKARATNPSLLGPYPDSGSNLMRYSNSLEVGVAAPDRYTYNPNLDVQSEFPTRRLLTDPYMDMGTSLPGSSIYMYSTYPDLRSRMPTNDVLSRGHRTTRQELPAGDRYAVYDQMRLNMHTRG